MFCTVATPVRFCSGRFGLSNQKAKIAIIIPWNMKSAQSFFGGALTLLAYTRDKAVLVFLLIFERNFIDEEKIETWRRFRSESTQWSNLLYGPWSQLVSCEILYCRSFLLFMSSPMWTGRHCWPNWPRTQNWVWCGLLYVKLVLAPISIWRMGLWLHK